MKIFISQSGRRSLALAQELQGFIRKLVPGTDPWVSPTGIEKGTRWSKELADSLEVAGAGIISLTSDNLTHPSILFEAGALSRKPSDKVWTVLLDVDYTTVEPPLSQFQHTKAAKADLKMMIESINKTVSAEKARHEGDLQELFELLWRGLEKRITEIRDMPTDGTAAVRATDDMLAEVLGAVRDIGRQSSIDSWRIEKLLGMLHNVYTATVGAKAPSLMDLRTRSRIDAAIEGLRTAGEDLNSQSGDTPLPLPGQEPKPPAERQE